MIQAALDVGRGDCGAVAPGGEKGHHSAGKHDQRKGERHAQPPPAAARNGIHQIDTPHPRLLGMLARFTIGKSAAVKGR